MASPQAFDHVPVLAEPLLAGCAELGELLVVRPDGGGTLAHWEAEDVLPEVCGGQGHLRFVHGAVHQAALEGKQGLTGLAIRLVCATAPPRRGR